MKGERSLDMRFFVATDPYTRERERTQPGCERKEGQRRSSQTFWAFFSQSVSQSFHGPTPRSPLHRLAVRLRHSRSVNSETNLNHGQDARANRTRHTTSSSTQPHAKQQLTNAPQTNLTFTASHAPPASCASSPLAHLARRCDRRGAPLWAKARKSHLLSGAPLAGLLPVVM